MLHITAITGRADPLASPAATSPAVAAEPALTPDRPGFTNGCEVVLPRRTEIEAGAAHAIAPSRAGGGIATDLPEILIRQGLTPQCELRVGLPDYLAVEQGAHGLGDGSMGVKYKFYQTRDGNTKAALIPALSIPIGAHALTSGHIDPLLTLAGQTISGARWGIAANLALSDPSQARGRAPAAAPSATVSYQLTPAFSTYCELYDSVAKSSLPTPIADEGLTYLVNRNLQFDAEAGWGLGGMAPIRFCGGGIAMRF